MKKNMKLILLFAIVLVVVTVFAVYQKQQKAIDPDGISELAMTKNEVVGNLQKPVVSHDVDVIITGYRTSGVQSNGGPVETKAVEQSQKRIEAKLSPAALAQRLTGELEEPIEADQVTGETSADDPNTPDEGESESQYTDPKTLTDIHFKKTSYRKRRGLQIKSECWFKNPDKRFRNTDYWYANDVGKWIIIKNCEDALVLDQKNKTAKIVEPKYFPPIDYKYGDVIKLIELGLSLISGKEPNRYNSDVYFAGRYTNYKYAPEKSTEDTVVYCTHKSGGQPGEIFIDSETGLVQKMVQVRYSGEERIEYSFDYSEIPLERFSFDIPEGYKDIIDRLPATVQGWIFDENLKPVPNADIYILGSWNEIGTHGKSDSHGHFNLDAFVHPLKPKPLDYPIFVHAVSDAHPGQVAWTIILHPDSKTKLPAVVPSSGDVIAKGDGVPPHGDCAGVRDVTLVLQPAVTIGGQITNAEDNTPITNASVRLIARGRYGALFHGIMGAGYEKGIRRSVKTDSKGYYYFESIPSFAWPHDSIKEAKEIAKRRDYRGSYTNYISIKTTAHAEGYTNNSGGVQLWPGDVLSDKHFDISLTPSHNVTVRGIVVDNYGQPVVGYGLRQYYERTESSTSLSYIKGSCTDENGKFEVTQCQYNKALGIQVASKTKSSEWGKSALTKGREFVYYASKTVPVGFEPGKLEYDIEIVLEKPELEFWFDIYDTSREPIEGMPVNIGSRSQYISEQWAWQLQAKTDASGQCVIKGMPRISFIDFTVNRHFTDETVDFEKEFGHEKLSQYISLPYEVRNPPVDEEGYIFQIMMPKKGEEFDSRESVKAFNSKGEEIIR